MRDEQGSLWLACMAVWRSRGAGGEYVWSIGPAVLRWRAPGASWRSGLVILARWRAERFLRRVYGLLSQPPSEGLRAAIAETAATLTAARLGPGLRTYREELVLIFARQLADGRMRLSSDHWSPGGGRNVGHDVLEAREAALTTLRRAVAARPRGGLVELISALDAVIAARRATVRDDDGYGAATLGEIRRDLERLVAASR